jgi:hypothetical protein
MLTRDESMGEKRCIDLWVRIGQGFHYLVFAFITSEGLYLQKFLVVHNLCIDFFLLLLQYKK